MTETIAHTAQTARQKKIETVCPVCGSKEFQQRMNYPNQSTVFSGMQIVQCGNCEMVFADPVPSEEELYIYNSHYFDNAHGGVSENPVTKAFHSGINLLRVTHIEKYLSVRERKIKRVLEIGPGAGYFAQHWRKRHPETVQYVVVDTDTSFTAAFTASGIEVYRDMQEIAPGNTFDLVVLSHVLEHVAEPQSFLLEIDKKLVHSGIVFIETPCRDDLHKPSLEPHLLFFDKHPMEQLIAKCGWKNGRLSYHGNTIAELRKETGFTGLLFRKARNFFLQQGIHYFWSRTKAGLEALTPMERAAVLPYKAHIEQEQPSWWLRSIAEKG